MKNLIIKLALLVITVLSSSAFADGKKLLQGRHLELVGGFTVPKVTIDKMVRRSMYLDLSPINNKWVTGHPKGYVVELLEPDGFGTGDASTWPSLIVSNKTQTLHNIAKISPGAVFWLNDNEVLASGRKHYRSGFTSTWLSSVNVKTGLETHYPISATENTPKDNFHLLQAMGGGFVRIHDKQWSAENLGGAEFLLGRGGYDVLGGPLGPSLGLWDVGDVNARFVLDFTEKNPAKRDPYYAYPNKDPDTFEKAQLPIWKDPETKGFWQGGSVGSIAIINHPSFKGLIYTSNHPRGILDYRAQGDFGSSDYFLVQQPAVFYNEGSGGNRGDHKAETLNADYPDGEIARVGNIIDPDFLGQVFNGKKHPYEAKISSFDWPRDGLQWSNTNKRQTNIGSVTWDDARQLLWVAVGNLEDVKLAAYRLIDDDTRKEPPLVLSDELRAFFDVDNTNIVSQPEPAPIPEPQPAPEEHAELEAYRQFVERYKDNLKALSADLSAIH